LKLEIVNPNAAGVDVSSTEMQTECKRSNKSESPKNKISIGTGRTSQNTKNEIQKNTERIGKITKTTK